MLGSISLFNKIKRVQKKFVFALMEGMLKILERTNDFKSISNTLKTHLQRNIFCTNYNYF